MLVEFNVANFRSLRERQTLSMVKAKGDELTDSNSFKTSNTNGLELLRSVAIYGPNAGGKSNVLRALKTMEQMVVKSAATLQRGDEVPVTPFRLSSESQHECSEFEVTFLVDQVRYQYGFSATSERVCDEWLLAYPKGRAQRWFDRTWNDDKKDYVWEFGASLTGERQLWQKSTRENALFLSTAVQLNSKQLQPVYDWFKTTLRIGEVGGWGRGFSASQCEKEEKIKIVDFLRAADLGIEDIRVKTEPFDPASLPDNMPQALKDELSRDLKDKKVMDIKTVHKTNEGELITFDLDEESDGTQRLFDFAGPWIDSLENGYVLFVDELHDNLHPKLVQFLVKLFHSHETNPKNAQLVFTTHETSILNQDVFRRDQIWFCEKGKDQSTSLYPLTDFGPRKGRENLELAYLSGRYGALPYIRPLMSSH